MRDSLAVSVGIRPVSIYQPTCPRLHFHFVWLLRRTQACKCVDTIDVHRTASADSLSATPSEGQGRVGLVLDADERVEHHRAGLVEVERVLLHVRLLGGFIGVPSVDLELLDASSRVGLRLQDVLLVLDDRGHCAAEELRRRHLGGQHAARCDSERHGRVCRR